MADLESPEFQQVAATSENQVHGPEETPPKIKAPATPEMFTQLVNELREFTNGLDCVHRLMFDVGNYYFAFQGVCLAAISNSSFFDCDNAWFLMMLCVLAAIPSLVALTFISLKWLWLTKQVDVIMSELEAIKVERKELDYTRTLSGATNCFSILTGRWYSPVVRYLLLMAGAVIFLTFTVAVASGPYTIIYGHIHPCWKGGCRSVVYPA